MSLSHHQKSHQIEWNNLKNNIYLKIDGINSPAFNTFNRMITAPTGVHFGTYKNYFTGLKWARDKSANKFRCWGEPPLFLMACQFIICWTLSVLCTEFTKHLLWMELEEICNVNLACQCYRHFVFLVFLSNTGTFKLNSRWKIWKFYFSGKIFAKYFLPLLCPDV